MKTRQQYRQEWLQRELIKQQRLKDIEVEEKIGNLTLNQKISTLSTNIQKNEQVTDPVS